MGFNVNSIQRQTQLSKPQIGFNVNSNQRHIQPLNCQIGFNVNSIQRQNQPLNHQIRFNVNYIQRQTELSKPYLNRTTLIVSIKKSILTIGIVITTMLLLTQKWSFCF